MPGAAAVLTMLSTLLRRFEFTEQLWVTKALEHMRMLEEEPRHKQTYWVKKIDSPRDALVDARSPS